MTKSIFFLLLLLSSKVICQNFQGKGTPKLVNYSNQTYGAQRQNWGISQSASSGFLYVANSKGLLEYDGIRWQLYGFPKVIRSVLVDKSGRIFTGALGEFGYWKPDESGELRYHSLRSKIEQPAFDQESVWNIVEIADGVVFQSFAFAYQLTKSGTIEELPSPGTINFLSVANNKLFVPAIGKGLYSLKDKVLMFLDGSEFLAKLSVAVILSGATTGSTLIGTSNGVFEYDGVTFRPFNDTLNRFLKENQLNKAVKIDENRLAFGTILNGIVITDAKGNILTIINKNTGLQNNTVLSMATDNKGNLWAGLDKGISKIELSSPLAYYNDFEGKLGAVYDIAEFENNLYVGSNRGLFVAPLQSGTFNFTLISGTQGQVWDLAVFNGQLLCGHNAGTFRIKGKRATKICDITGGWTIRQLIKNPEWLVQGTYTKLIFYKKDDEGKWNLHHFLPDFSESVKQIEEDSDGTLWVNRTNKGISKLQFSDDFTKIRKRVDYDKVPMNHAGTNLTLQSGNIHVFSNDGFFQFDAARNKFIKLADFQLSSIVKLFPIQQTKGYAIADNGEVFYLPHLKATPQFLLEEQFVEGYQNIVRINSTVFFCLEEGFTWVDESKLLASTAETDRPPILRRIKIEDFPTLNRTFHQKPTPITLEYNQNNLTFQFAPSGISDSSPYSFWLENHSKKWSAPQKVPEKTFYNLSPDTYTLHLRSNRNTAETTFTFTINAPWYWNGISKIGYFLTLLFIIYIIYQVHLKNLQKHRFNLQEVHREQVIKKENEIIQLRNRQLENEVKQKSGELANSTMSLIKKNELLTKIKDEVVKATNAKEPTSTSIRPLINMIDKNISTNNDWKVFETNFNEVHETFLNKLTTLYPDLTHGDLKLAAYLRMNLSTKEIAQLLNITNRSVELKRYRLRKKLDIETEENLTDFVMKI